MIEDGTGSQHSGQVGPGSGGISMVTKQQQDEIGQRPQYSMPGILHFLQTEWARFEMERSQWEVERAELQVSQSMKICLHCINEIAFSLHYSTAFSGNGICQLHLLAQESA